MKLKCAPEEFIVIERPSREFQTQGSYAIFKVTKRLRNTEEVAYLLAKALKVPRKAISYAGSKDRNALTTQFFSVRSPFIEPGPAIEDLQSELVGFSEEPLSLGDLSGNEFAILVRDLDGPLHAKEFIPNFFGPQRFGTRNDEIGLALIRKEFKQACELCDDARVAEFLAKQPTNFIGALRSLPKKQLMLYVHAFQSRLFNERLKHLLEEKSVDDLRGMQLALPGFDNDDESLKAHGLTTRDFIIRELPDATCEGALRDAVVKVQELSIGPLEDDELHQGKKKCLVKFFLPKGAYATVVIGSLQSE